MAQEPDVSTLFVKAQDAELGVHAQILLAEAYLNGNVFINGVKEKNQAYLGEHWLKSAVFLLLQAKELGHYEKLSLTKLSKLAENGYTEAQYQLALLNLSKNEDKENSLSTYTGIYWLYQAALQGHEKAIEIFIAQEREVSNYEKMKANYWLGLLYWDEKIVINGSKEANQKAKGIQHLYESAMLDTGSYQRALDKLQEIANDNHPEAQYKLAQLCFAGKIAIKETPDTFQGVKWLYKAAVSGHKDAMDLLEKKQDILAICGYKKFMGMQYTLGVMYLEGSQSVAVDFSKAVKYLEFAKKNGDNNSELKLIEARNKLKSLENTRKEIDADMKWIKDFKSISLSQTGSFAYTTAQSGPLKNSDESGASPINSHESLINQPITNNSL